MADYVAAHELGTYSIKVMGECLAPRIVNRLLFPGEKIAFVLQGIRDCLDGGLEDEWLEEWLE